MHNENPQKSQTKQRLPTWLKGLLLLTAFILFAALFIQDATGTTPPKRPWWWHIH